MMNTEERESLEAIRFKITHNQTDFDRQEVLHLAVVYAYVSRYAGKERILKTDCQGCLLTAMNVVSNYVKFYEDIDKPIENVVNIEKAEPTLRELREQYPEIKSNSVKGFLEKLNNK